MKSYITTLAFVFSCLTYSLSVILNTLGIYILSNLKHELTNQRMYLINLSFSELLYASTTLGYYLIDEFSDNDDSTVYATFSRLSWLFYYLYLISPLFLTMDRFVAITFPFKYKAISTKTKAIAVVLLSWICVFLTAIPALFITDYETARSSHLPAMALGIAVLVIAFAVCAYIVIGLKVHKQRKSVGRANSNPKILKVATIIIVTYFLLELIPDLVTTVLLKSNFNIARDYRRVIYLPGTLNTICDPIIYVYNYPPLKIAVRKKVKHVTKKLGCTSETVDNALRSENLFRLGTSV